MMVWLKVIQVVVVLVLVCRRGKERTDYMASVTVSVNLMCEKKTNVMIIFIEFDVTISPNKGHHSLTLMSIALVPWLLGS